MHDLLYTDKSLTPVASGPARLSHPAIGLEVGLNPSGQVEYGTKGWKVTLTPNFQLSSPTLHKGSSTQLLRADDGEIGLSFDKDATRHFFLFAKAPPSPFLLALGQLEGSTSLEFNDQEGYAAFSDKEKLLLVYSAPVLRLANNKTISLPITWKGDAGSIAIDIPSDVAFPAVLAFGVSSKRPTAEGAPKHFGNLRLGLDVSSSDSDNSSASDDDDVKPVKQKRVPISKEQEVLSYY